MATPLTDGINTLISYANEVTGASDTTLSGAVETLVAGYGQGGSASPITYLTQVTATGNYSKVQEGCAHLLEIVLSAFPTESKHLLLLYHGVLSPQAVLAKNQCTMFICRIAGGASSSDYAYRRYASDDDNLFAYAGTSTSGTNNLTINAGDVFDVFELAI